MTKIAIVVLNWRQPDLTVNTIDSLLKIKHPSFDFKIILVDNGSSDNSLEIFKQKYSNNKYLKIINTGSNQGYVGNNYGIKYAIKHKYDYIVLLNNDVLVDPNFLEELLKKSKNYDLLGPKIYFAPGFEYHKNRYKKNEIGNVIWSVGGKMDWNNIYGSNLGVDEVDHGQFEQINDNVDFISGCCLMASKKVYKTIGLLDKNYFMYLEDVDLCQKAKNNGFKLAYIPNSIIWHINAGSSKSGGDLHNYFMTRNRIYFANKYARLRTKFAIFRESIKILLITNSGWKKRAVIDAYTHKMGKGAWQ